VAGEAGRWGRGSGGTDKSEQEEDGNTHGPNETTTAPETRLHYHVTRPTCQGHVAAHVSICLRLPSLLRPPWRGALKASPASGASVGSPSASRSRREFSRCRFPFPHEEEGELGFGGLNPNRHLAAVVQCPREIRVEI